MEKSDKLSHLIYKYTLNSQLNFKWTESINNILNSTGLSHVWLQQENIISKTIHNNVRKVLIDQFIKKWRSQLEVSSKGQLYALFKEENTQIEKYMLILPESLKRDYTIFYMC